MRRHDWPEALAEVCKRARGAEFAWGRHDCALFACDCVHAMTGVDHGLAFRGTYRTPEGAARALKVHGKARNIAELATKVLGPPIAVNLAQRGDLACVPTELGPALGVVAGARVAVAGASGLIFVALSEATRAWRVS